VDGRRSIPIKVSTIMATPRKKPEDKLKVGRPTDYRPEYCDQIIALGEQGRSKTQMARAFKVTRVTLDNWAKANPEFLYALTRAMEEAEAAWEDKADGGIEAAGFNTGLWGRVMSARFPATYRETTRSEVTGANGGAIQTEEVGKGFGGWAEFIEMAQKEAEKGKK
jgi:hypothetical protein